MAGGGGGVVVPLPMETLTGSLVEPFGPVQVIGKAAVAVTDTVA